MTDRVRPDRYGWLGPVLVSVVAILVAPAGLAQAQAQCQWLGTVDMSGRDRDHVRPAVAPIGPGETVAQRLSLALRYAGAGQSYEGQNEFERALNEYLTAVDVFRGDVAALQLQPPQPEQVEFLLAYTMISIDVARLRLR